MLEETIHNSIVRLFSGEASPDEKKRIRDWLKQSDSNRKIYSGLQDIWLATGTIRGNEEYDTEKAISRFKERIQKDNKGNVFRLSNFLKYAAIVVLLVSLPFMYYFGKQSTAPDSSFTTISCALGDKSNITLPDGSRVILNSGSEITFNNNFQGQRRNVSLKGEAYFEVQKNNEIPFIVKAAEIEIKVLGTEFNVKAYPDEDFISTTLVEGSVQISSEEQKVVMKPNQKIVFNRMDKRMKLYNLNDVIPETEWKDGRLVFRNESLEELEPKLERWFDVEIEFADGAVKRRRFTGTLERESILEALTYFNYSEHVGSRIKGNTIIFFSK